MKLPPILAEPGLAGKPERTKRIPPKAAFDMNGRMTREAGVGIAAPECPAI